MIFPMDCGRGPLRERYRGTTRDSGSNPKHSYPVVVAENSTIDPVGFLLGTDKIRLGVGSSFRLTLDCGR